MKKSSLSGKENCSFFDVRILFWVVTNCSKRKIKKVLIFQFKMSTIHLALKEKEC